MILHRWRGAHERSFDVSMREYDHYYDMHSTGRSVGPQIASCFPRFSHDARRADMRRRPSAPRARAAGLSLMPASREHEFLKFLSPILALSTIATILFIDLL